VKSFEIDMKTYVDTLLQKEQECTNEINDKKKKYLSVKKKTPNLKRNLIRSHQIFGGLFYI
jgi:hypothetical protein